MFSLFHVYNRLVYYFDTIPADRDLKMIAVFSFIGVTSRSIQNALLVAGLS